MDIKCTLTMDDTSDESDFIDSDSDSKTDVSDEEL